MPQLESIISVSLAGLALSATPGPSMLYVLSRTVGQGRAAGLASAFGLAVGGLVLAVATALGLSVIFTSVEWLVPVLRYIGSAYLVWLGLGMIREARTQAQAVLETDSVTGRPFSAVFWQGVLVELLNPKTVLFFALFLPPFVAMDTGPAHQGSVQMELLILGALEPLTAIPSDILVAFMGGSMAEMINRKQKIREVLGYAGGALLILIALNLHLGII